MIVFGNCIVFKSTEVAFSNAQITQKKVKSSYMMA